MSLISTCMIDLDFGKPTPFVSYSDGKETIVDTYEAANEDIIRMWYSGICSPQELKRILHVSNAQDYILRAAVDTISVHTRLHREILALQRASGHSWSLEAFLSPLTFGYQNFKNHLPPSYKAKVKHIGTGCIFDNDMNGIIFDSPFGLCSTLSYSILYFIKFASLALWPYLESVPIDVRTASLRIATRIALQIESMDFNLDPRGIIPKEIERQIHAPFPYICTFLAGHEYCHFLNGDIAHNSDLGKTENVIRYMNRLDSWKSEIYYSCHEKELQADLQSVNLPLFNSTDYANYYCYVLFWFAILAIVESAEETIFPPTRTPSHPSAKVRYRNIIENARKPIDYSQNEKLYTEFFPDMIDSYRKALIDDVTCNFENYEMYGSAYLAEPNTQWRGRELIDRVDF